MALLTNKFCYKNGVLCLIDFAFGRPKNTMCILERPSLKVKSLKVNKN